MCQSQTIFRVQGVFCDAGGRPGGRLTFVSAKVSKTMLAMLWPFGFPVRFADTGVAQTRCAQTMRAFFSVVGCTARPHHKARGDCSDRFASKSDLARDLAAPKAGILSKSVIPAGG